MDDPRDERQRRIAAEPVFGHEDLERAQAVPVRVARARCVEAEGTGAVGVSEDVVARHVGDRGVSVDEPPDQPGTRDPVRVRVLAGDP
ncbi:MAG TPA: hypothetical protein VF802_04910, partial [Candidatus Limnocylindrales bacterium]